ncbi:hypothetical protein TIFTF001_008533 [Ficus carica]|uniref:Uncharacterized protein n=1 Tax=Ficus carica TaxID=3494 RepID=A0AA87ZTK6_FICCA|nr:hypothetical protein TIFTF001_008533 [Ficus carica]
MRESREFQVDSASCEMIKDEVRMILMWSKIKSDELGGSPMISYAWGENISLDVILMKIQ